MTRTPIGLVTISCGNCCHSVALCENCLVATLKANGLSADLMCRIRGLQQKAHGYGGHDASEFSELRRELRALAAPKACPWCKDGFIAESGLLCRTCGGTGRQDIPGGSK